MNRLFQLSSSLTISQVPLLLTAFALILSVPLQTAQACVHMDFVVLLHDAGQISTNDAVDYSYAAAYKGMIESFAKVFALADDKTRVSVVGREANQYAVLLPLTSDKATWESALTKTYTFDLNKVPSIQDGLKTVRENVFNDQSVPSKARVVLVSSFTDDKEERFGLELGQEVKRLNDMGNTLILAVTRDSVEQAPTQNIRGKMHEGFTEDLVFHASRYEKIIEEFSKNLPAWILEKVNKKFCKATNSPPKPNTDEPKSSEPTKPTKLSEPTKPSDTPDPDEENEGGSWAECVRPSGVLPMMASMAALRLVI